MKRTLRILLITLVMLQAAIAAPNPGHSAESIGGGTFSAGNFTFPERVGIGITGPIHETLIVNGSINASGTITGTAGIDLAEMFQTVMPVEAGQIVSAVDGNTVTLAVPGNAGDIIGVRSMNPGMVLGRTDLEDPIMIALAGRVPVRVTGNVTRGDYITISETPGIGKRAQTAAFVVGRALEDAQDGTVTILVEPGYFSPQVDEFQQLIGANQKTFERVAPGGGLAISAPNVQLAALQAEVAALQAEVAALRNMIETLMTGNQTIPTNQTIGFGPRISQTEHGVVVMLE